MARMAGWRGTLCGAMVCVCALAAWARPKPPRNPPAVTLSARHWTTIRLPATPLGIAAHGKDLWVCGWDEMIAESRDGGRTWRIRHFRPNGELLFTLAFAAPHHVYAFGAEDISLASKNGGRSWSDWGSPGFTVTQAFFAGPKRDFLVGPSGFGFGHPQEWRAEMALRLSTVVSATVLNAHGAVLLEERLPDRTGLVRGPKRFWLLRSSSVGGPWSSLSIHRAVPLGVAAARGRYWVAARSSGKLRPLLLSSSDGAHWRMVLGVKRLGALCTSQGCRTNRGWEPFADPSAFTLPWSYPVPLDHRIITGWASAAGVVCDVGDTLRCALTGPPRRDPPTAYPARSRIGKGMRLHCLRCASPSLAPLLLRRYRDDQVRLAAWVGPRGRVVALALRAAPSAFAAHAALAAASRWRFRPVLLRGQAVGVPAEFIVDFRGGTRR